MKRYILSSFVFLLLLGTMQSFAQIDEIKKLKMRIDSLKRQLREIKLVEDSLKISKNKVNYPSLTINNCQQINNHKYPFAENFAKALDIFKKSTDVDSLNLGLKYAKKADLEYRLMRRRDIKRYERSSICYLIYANIKQLIEDFKKKIDDQYTVIRQLSKDYNNDTHKQINKLQRTKKSLNNAAMYSNKSMFWSSYNFLNQNTPRTNVMEMALFKNFKYKDIINQYQENNLSKYDKTFLFLMLKEFNEGLIDLKATSPEDSRNKLARLTSNQTIQTHNGFLIIPNYSRMLVKKNKRIDDPIGKARRIDLNSAVEQGLVEVKIKYVKTKK